MNEANDITLAKRILRHQMHDGLRALSDDHGRAASSAACQRVASLPVFQNAHTLMLYLPLPGEVDCTSLIEQALREGRTVCVPHVHWDSRSMQPARLESLRAEAIVADRHGVRVPAKIDPVPIERLDLVIVPGLAFDERGRRLGRGGGFYDRFIALLPTSIPTVGLAFERQIVDTVPAAEHDAIVRLLATERRLIGEA